MHNRILSQSSILTGTCGVLIIILPFLCYLYRNAFSDYVPIFVSSMSICLILIVHAANSHIGSRIRITVLDLLVAAYLTWGVFNLWLIRPDWPSLRFWSEWIFLVCTYLAARLFFTDRQKVLAGFIVISGVAQSLWGIMQAIRVLPPGHEYFAATGAFPNPGPWGGYVSISLISCIMTIIDAKKGKNTQVFLYPIAGILCLALFLSDSRASWIASIAVLLYLSWDRLRLGVSFSNKYRIIVATFIAILFAAGSYGLYRYKKESAEGRMLIWKSCVELVSEKFWTGHGIGIFPILYMDAQAHYVAKHPESRFNMSATNNTQAFNEIIHTTAEQGIIGAIVLLSVIGTAFYYGRHQWTGPVLIGLTTFSLFSYPADILPLKLFFPLLVGSTRSPTIAAIRFGKFHFIIAIALLISIFIFTIRAYRIYNVSFTQLHNPIPRISSYDKMKYDQHFMLCYAKQLYNRRQYHTFITIEQDLSRQITSYDILYDLGNACYRLGKFSRVVEYYEKAHRMIPTRIAPLYRIFTIYRSEGCNAEAQEKAHQIIDLPVKISNSETLRAKSQAKTFLNEHRPDEEQ